MVSSVRIKGSGSGSKCQGSGTLPTISRTWVVAAGGARPEVRLGRAARLIGGLHEHTALDEGGEGVEVRHENDGVDQLGQGPVGGGGRVRQRLHHTRMKRSSIWHYFRCCGSGMIIPDPNFFNPGSEFFPSRIRIFSVPDPRCSSRIRIF